ncbi:hypothetical protein HU200_050664 [Digitaria exilis]|uniref:Meg domain-containing protein n=1 Tax=Digitaria exilis TaxID=1010633 RepID=A0A835A1H5_9POAL|nr:hypothetical protein HU200_066859 [Digitaria exilis]KAF8670435.1 hypothetical protein HU200_050664 [Digitaria exilis]
MEKCTKQASALVCFSLFLLGYFAAYAQNIGQGIDEVGAPAPGPGPAEQGFQKLSGAQCAQGFLPCKDNKCWCCIGGRTKQCFSTQAQCSHACG